MPIEYIAVKCCQERCGTFQVVQKRKDSKWDCRICSQKQSIIKASDLRPIVQKYNLERGQKIENAPPKRKATNADDEINHLFGEENQQNEQEEQQESNPPKRSKWSEYAVEEETKYPVQNDSEEEKDPRFVTSVPQKQKGQRRNNEKGKKNNPNDIQDSGEIEEKVIDDQSVSFSSKRGGKYGRRGGHSGAAPSHSKFAKSSSSSSFTNTTLNKSQAVSANMLNNRSFPLIHNNNPLNNEFETLDNIDDLLANIDESQFIPKTVPSIPKSNSKQAKKPVVKPGSKWSQFGGAEDSGPSSGEEGDFATTTNDGYQVQNEEEVI